MVHRNQFFLTVNTHEIVINLSDNVKKEILSGLTLRLTFDTTVVTFDPTPGRRVQL